MRASVLVFLAVLLGLAFGLGLTVVELGASTKGTVDENLSTKAQPISPDGPHVVVDKEDYDYGSMEREGRKSHVFTITNEGRSQLKLIKGESTCRCTKFEIAKLDLDPGESTTVTIEWHATVPPGRFRQSATIDTNDPARPSLTFTITGDVTSSHKLVPDSLAFTGISANEPHTTTANIYSYREGQLEVTGHEFSDAQTADKFGVKTEKLSPDTIQAEKDAQSGVAVSVTVKPGLPLGEFRQILKLRLNQSDDPVELPIEGNIVSDVIVAGRGWDDERTLLTLGTVSGREGTQTQLFIVAHGADRQKLHPTIKKVTPDLLKVSLGTPLSGEANSPVRVPVDIEISPGSRPALHLGGEEGKLGEILIDSGLPKADTIRIRVRFAIGE
jgi:hypothetical protein